LAINLDYQLTALCDQRYNYLLDRALWTRSATGTQQLNPTPSVSKTASPLKMAPCDTQTPAPAGAVAQIKLEIRRPGGEIEKGEPTSCWQLSIL
jgi:hypothetical protein